MGSSCLKFITEGLDLKIRFMVRIAEGPQSRSCFLHSPGPQEGRVSPGSELSEQLYSSRAVAADLRERHMPLPYQLAENLLYTMPFCFSLRNLLGFFFFLPFLFFCFRCALC